MGAGKKAKQTWTPRKMNLAGLITGSTVHKEGDKDGLAFLQGSNFGGARAAVSMDKLFIIGVDIDDGTPTTELDEKIAATGLFCIRYTTHSHGKPVTEVKQKDFITFQKKIPALARKSICYRRNGICRASQKALRLVKQSGGLKACVSSYSISRWTKTA